MKLISLKVKNYRIHVEQDVEFDPARTVIGGPNESGKSTLLEAAHRVLFLNHRRGGKDLKSMRSDFSPDPPEVELVFEQHGARYTLRKRFNGTNGHAELLSCQHERWLGEEAETKLAGLLGYDAPVSPKSADSQWAHLWIRQGSSGEDPSGQATLERDTLLARLQAQGGAAVMQSDLDARVATHFAGECERLFNQNGTPRAGSNLARAASALQEAEHQLNERRSQTARLAQAAQAFESASIRQEEAAAAIPILEKSLVETEEKLRAAGVIESELAGVERQLDEAKRNYNDLHQKDLAIRNLAADIAAKAERIAPLRSQCAGADAHRAELEKTLQLAHEQAGRAATEVQATRDRVDWLKALTEALNAGRELAGTRNRQATIDALRTSLEKPNAELARLPDIRKKDLDALRKLESGRAEAAAALDAIATGIEFLSGPGTAQLAGAPVSPGESRVITEAAEIEVAGHRFRIRPGGGNRLNEAREALADHSRRLDAALQSFGVRDLAGAIRTHELRNAAEVECRQIRIQIDALEPESTSQHLARLEQSCLELGSRSQRLMKTAGATEEPEHADSALREALLS